MAPSTHNAQGLLFDMDGTLIDSFAAANRAWGAWASRVGLGDQFSLEGSVHGRQRPDVIRDLMPDWSDAQAAEAAEEIRIAERDDVEGVVALPGAAELLASIPHGHWAIVTSCDDEVARARLHQAGLPIPSVFITADRVSHSKPHPEGFLAAASGLGIEPANALVFEDAPAGIAAGLAAGMRVIASRFTQPNDEALDGAIAYFDTPAALRVEVLEESLEVLVSESVSPMPD